MLSIARRFIIRPHPNPLAGSRRIRSLLPKAEGRRRRAAFTLVEMLVTVAILIIILARHVREESARQLTKDVLRRMDDAMSQYLKLDANRIPDVPAFIPGPD